MKDFLKNLKINEGNISLGLGVTVMIVAGVMLFNYFRTANAPKGNAEENISSASTEVTPTPQAGENKNENILATAPIAQGSEYTVQKNDSLWRISERTYGTGDNWKLVYEANKDKLGNNPGVIAAGTKLNMPKVEVNAQVEQEKPEATQLTATEYKVIKGDNLWNISVKTCGSGFVYPEIAKQNNISNPSLIYPDQVIKLTCPAKK